MKSVDGDVRRLLPDMVPQNNMIQIPLRRRMPGENSNQHP